MRKMKDSGIEWIPSIPEDWNVYRLKNLGFLYGGLTGKAGKDFEVEDNDNYMLFIPFTNIFNNLFIDTETLYKVKIKDGEIQNTVNKNDILFLMSSEDFEGVGKPSLMTEQVENLGLNSFCKGFRLTSENATPKYLLYYLSSHVVRELIRTEARGFIRINLRQSALNEVPLFLPTIEEQQSIATYLDTKCSEIDTIVRETEQTIEEYKKLKQSLITEVVTGKKRVADDGLSLSDEPREMKDSGVEWIGEVPREWELRPFRHILKERSEKNNPIQSEERLSLSIELGVTLYSEKTTNLDRFKDDFTQYKLAHEGDLVMNSMNMIVGASGVSKYFGCVSPVYYTYYDELEDHTTAKYCEYIFRSKTMLRVLYSLGKGIYAIERGDDKVNTCRLKVSKEDLKSIIIPSPTEKEQRNIVNFLNSKCSEIDRLISDKQRLLEELEIYKKSLIYECVTGKREIN